MRKLRHLAALPLLWLFAAIGVSAVPSGAGGNILWYKKTCGEGHLATMLDVRGQCYNLKDSKVMKNDEAASLVLQNVRKGAKITIYDNPDGKTNDDWAVIEVLKTASSYTVNSFERSYEDAHVRVTFHRKNGLKGKVSRVVID